MLIIRGLWMSTALMSLLFKESEHVIHRCPYYSRNLSMLVSKDYACPQHCCPYYCIRQRPIRVFEPPAIIRRSSLSALLCSVATCIFLTHSYVIVLVVMLKTIKTSAFFCISVRFVLLYAEVLNQMCAYCYC